MTGLAVLSLRVALVGRRDSTEGVALTSQLDAPRLFGMLPQEPSRTALGAARHRAAHQVLEGGRIFSDPLALAILGRDASSAVRDAKNDPNTRKLRLFIAVRSRFAEDSVRSTAAQGLGQLVVLGAGLDTFAYRSLLGEGVRVFEVDHPATQAWKRQRLADASIPVPSSLTFAPVDFERESLAHGLSRAGFDPALQTFFTWLGVVPYLSEEAVFSTLRFVASLKGGAHVVFDYANPASGSDRDQDSAVERLATRVALAGEPLLSFFETESLHVRLTSLGFGEIEDLGPALIRERYFPGRKGRVPSGGGHILRATTLKKR